MNPASSLAGLRPPKVAGLNFTAVDFETANGFRGSPCAIGLVRVRDGNVDELYFRRMRPPEGFDRFDPRNTAVHGITAERVAAEPRFGQVFSEVAAFIGDDTLVAHNAAFDVEVFESSLEVSGLDSPGLRALCSVRLARAVYKLDSHALPNAAAEAGFHLKHHHHALWDARAAAAIVVDIAQREQVGELHALFGRHFIAPEECEPWKAPREAESRATRQVRSYGSIFDASAAGKDGSGVADDALPELMQWQDEGPNLPPNPEADSQHRLFGQHVAFTGTLAVPRTQAKALAAHCGATTSSRVTGSTTLLVVGDGFAVEDLDEQHRSTLGRSHPLKARKAREALERVSGGQPIRFISESDFRQMLGHLWPSGTGEATAAS